MPHNYGPVQSFLAGSDLRTKQFYVVELTGANQVDLANAATDVAIGVLLNKPNSGQAASILTAQGVRVPAILDGTADIAVGDLLGVNASGALIKKATPDFATSALALEACTTNGLEIHDVLWLGPSYFRTAGV